MPRTYIPLPDPTKRPKAYIQAFNSPFPGCTLLLNGLWVTKDRYARPGELKWEIVEPGDNKTRTYAHVAARAKTERQAIILALDLRPVEPLEEKAKRVEAEALKGYDPSILEVVEDLFAQCRNVLGPIGAGIKYRLRSYTLEPTIENWEDIDGIILAGEGFHTVWQLWLEEDPTAPRCGPATNAREELHNEWDRIPTPMELLVILQKAAQEVEECAS